MPIGKRVTEATTASVATFATFPVRYRMEILQRPVWWLNLFSLDAVLVALAWQLAFSLSFCTRTPHMSECVMLGLTVWIAYTADRLLDASRLNLHKRHSLRHRVHTDYRKPILILWLAALVLDLALIASLASWSQLRWGLGCLFMVCAYMTRIHQANLRIRLPKELMAGSLFAFGVSLLAWSSGDTGHLLSLGLSVILAGILFSTNCAAVAYWERGEDEEQEFRSWIRNPRRARQTLSLMLVLLCVTGFLLGLFEWIPGDLAACLSLGGLSLLAVWLLSHFEVAEFDSHLVSLPNRWSLLADLSLAWPPFSVWMIG